ncbi:MAG: ParA family protein [Chitinophagaceae bacterium]
MCVISVAIQKGGSGKTTTAVNLAAALLRRQKKVLLIDSDPQANLTHSLGVADDLPLNLYTEYQKEVSGREGDLRSTIVVTESGLPVIPSSRDLAGMEQDLFSRMAREYKLRKRLLYKLVDEYDYIIIDCPPSFGMLTINALTASNYVVMPLQAEFLPRKGVESFLQLLDSAREQLSLDIRLAGFLLTKYSPRKSVNIETREWLMTNFGQFLFNSFIHTDIRVSVAQRKGLDIFSYAPRSVAAADYAQFADELILKISPPPDSAQALQTHAELYDNF